MSRATAKCFAPFVAALFVASCSLFAAPDEATKVRAREVAACIVDVRCETRRCVEAAVLRCGADSIESSGGAAGAQH